MKNNLTHNHQHVTVVFWLLVSVTFWMQFLVSTSSVGEATLLAGGICGSIILLNHYICNYLLKKAIRTKRFTIFWIQFIALCIPMSMLVSLVYSLFQYLEEIGVFEPSFLFSDQNNLFTNFIIVLPGMVVICLGFCGLRFYYEHMLLEKINSQIIFKTLQQQITPHFMFNILNHIYILMQENVELASTLLEKYSEILRYQLYNGQIESISLEQEVHFLQNYIGVEHIRWEDKLEVNSTWEVENGTIKIPPLLLLTFIENAFKHASKNSKKKGSVYINFKQSGDNINLEVENSCSPHTPHPSTGLGLKNTRQRLEILFHKDYRLDIDETDTHYKTRLSITLHP